MTTLALRSSEKVIRESVLRVPTRGVVGDSCHSATRQDLRIGDSVVSHLREKKLVFIYICKALYNVVQWIGMVVDAV